MSNAARVDHAESVAVVSKKWTAILGFISASAGLLVGALGAYNLILNSLQNFDEIEALHLEGRTPGSDDEVFGHGQSAGELRAYVDQQIAALGQQGGSLVLSDYVLKSQIQQILKENFVVQYFDDNDLGSGGVLSDSALYCALAHVDDDVDSQWCAVSQEEGVWTLRTGRGLGGAGCAAFCLAFSEP